eukprot:scaffold86008_cov60-Phaeocystis_antarctica.AAC.2
MPSSCLGFSMVPIDEHRRGTDNPVCRVKELVLTQPSASPDTTLALARGVFVSSFGVHVWCHPLRARARVGGGVERVGVHLVETDTSIGKLYFISLSTCEGRKCQCQTKVQGKYKQRVSERVGGVRVA